MPLVDKPLAELYHYQGINPRPTDFDHYWDTSLAEMQAIDPQIALVPYTGLHSKIADCFDLYFTGIGGARIHAKYLCPKSFTKPHPAILQFHGYAWHSGDWTDKLALVSQGFSVAALDCRGQGGLSEDTGRIVGNTHSGHIIRGIDDPDPRNLYYRAAFLDTAQLARIVMGFAEIDENRVGAQGGSQGGALTIACAALEPRIKRIAPVYPFLSDYKRVWDMDLCKDAYAEFDSYFRRFDPRHERETEFFNKLGYIDIQHLAPRIRAETLLFIGLMDTVCPPSTQFAAYNKIKAKKDIIIYPDFRHEGLPDESRLTFNFLSQL
jgi:cephalosporin-C deacetylase